MPGPARVVRAWRGPARSRPPCPRQDVLGLLRLGDEAHRDGGEAGLGLDPLGIGHLIARPDLDRLLGRDAPVETWIAGEPLLQGLGEFHRLVEVPAVLHPIRRGDPEPDRRTGGHDLPHRVVDLQRVSASVGEAAAVFVRALVGDGREELVQQVAVGAVQLHGLDPEAHGALGGGHELVAHPLQVGGVEACGGTSPSPCATGTAPRCASRRGDPARSACRRPRGRRSTPCGRHGRSGCRPGSARIRAPRRGRGPAPARSRRCRGRDPRR